MTKQDKTYWSNFRTYTHTTLDHEEYMQVCEIYARIKNVKAFYPCKNCGSSVKTLQNYIDEINIEFEKYE